MDVEAAFSRLPETHAAALRLRARGLDDDAIAAALALEPAAVAPLLQIAEAKLAALTAHSGAAIVAPTDGRVATFSTTASGTQLAPSPDQP